MASRLHPSALALAAALACGCVASRAPAPDAAFVATYETRGRIDHMPRADLPGAPIVIQHEEVPGFQNATGQIVGLRGMKTVFPLDPAVSLDGLAPGDPVKLSFTVDWGKSPRYRLVRIEKLQQDVVLKLE